MMRQEAQIKTGGWRSFLAIVLAASLALGLMPAGATEAYAATKQKSYVYDVVYGTYQGKYAIGFKGIGSKVEEIHVVSATSGVRMKVNSNDFGGNIDSFRSWTTSLTHAFADNGTYVAGVIGLPVRVKGGVKYAPHTLEGKKISKKLYDQVAYFQTKQFKGHAGTVLLQQNGTTGTADVFDCSGKKVQTISKAFPKGFSNMYAFASDWWDGKNVYLRLSASASSGEGGREHMDAWYVLKGGKFVKSEEPTYSSDDQDSGHLFNHVADGIYLEEEWDNSIDDWKYYLKHPNGKKVYLPRHLDKDQHYSDGTRYYVAEDLGVYAISEGVVFVYNKNGKLLGTASSAHNSHLSKSIIPGVWSFGDAAYNASFQLIKKSSYQYGSARSKGKFGGKKVYCVRNANDTFDKGYFIDAALNPITAGEGMLVSNYWSSTPIHTFKNGRQIAVAKNSSGKFGVVDTKGNVLIPFSYSDFYDTGSGDYIMMKKGKGWQFVKVSHLASGKAVKGGVYTVGKLKYKVTSTAKKSAAVMVVGHAKGKKATGNVSIPSTVKIAGQKFKVTAVGSNAFKGASVSSVALGKYVKTIGSGAFYGCKSLKAATLGTSVKTVGKNAFAGCKKLAKVTVKSKAMKSVGKSAFKGINKKAKFKVPKAKMKAYKKLLNSKAGIKRTMKVTK